MKLSKSDVKKICKEFDLGEPIYCKPLKRGMVNFNFYLKTSKGKFIIRTISRKFDSKQRLKTNLEFKIQRYLIKNKFPYQIPFALTNRRGKRLSTIQGKKYWVYKRIEGNSVKKSNPKKDIATIQALALYHLALKDFKLPHPSKHDLSWLENKYKEMKQIFPNSDVNKLVLEN